MESFRQIIEKVLLLGAISFFACCSSEQHQWEMAGDKISTTWGEKLNPKNVLQEYPRPIMERSKWKNLNGLWEYAIVPRGTQTFAPQGAILVPFAVESALSGVGKSVGAENELRYRRSFEVPSSWKHDRVLLHFGAVDYECSVFVNGKPIGEHTGGYTAFHFDITDALVEGDNILEVTVFDPTDDGVQAIGKQRKKPHGIWYTSVTGIWQTIWMEPVGEKRIEKLDILSDIDAETLQVKALVSEQAKGCDVMVMVYEGRRQIASEKVPAGEVAILPIRNMKLWSPDSPFLYDLKVALLDKGKLTDNVKSYAAMRKISTKMDADSVVRMTLNNETLFQFGTLDQGWWPDGLYTAPSDEALEFDIIKTKELGFNMIRKHVKVEPQRWYYHCDRLGMLVWQDMPSGDFPGTKWDGQRTIVTKDAKTRSEASAQGYYQEWNNIMDMLYSYPCIVMWVPFNEAWGQFNTTEVSQFTKAKDPNRLVNIASGGNLFRTGDVIDIHNYPQPEMYLYESGFVNVLGEYGGIGLPVSGHLWIEDNTEKNWGYIKMEDKDQVTSQFVGYIDSLRPLIQRGFSAAIYTQITDVEIEVNGLMTYDRKVMKVDPERISKAIKSLYTKVYAESLILCDEDFKADVKGSKTLLYTLRNDNGMIVQLTNYGARMVSLIVPDRDGQATDVIWGYNSIQGYLETTDFFSGPIVGRYANRIGGSTFSIDGTSYKLSPNEGKNQLHGGANGIYTHIWDARPYKNKAGEDAVEMTLLSPDGEEGYPGEMSISVTYTLHADNSLELTYSATTDRPTICNLTSHAYFNLHGTTSKSSNTHLLWVDASSYTPTDSELIPSGEIASVAGTPCDFRKPSVIGQKGTGEFDMNFVLNDHTGVALIASLYEPSNGIKMEIYSDQKGLQFYSGLAMNGKDIGKREDIHYKFSGLALEPQNFPDAPNHKNFPSAILRPGETYSHNSIYKFSVEK